MLSRRDLVGRLAIGAAGALALAASGKGVKAAVQPHAGERPERGDDLAEELPAAVEPQEAAQQAAAPPSLPKSEPPWQLLEPLKPGAPVAYGWRLSDLSGPADGACVLTLQNERGRVQRVHLCRNDGRPQGFVYTQHLDLVVMNGGRGDLGTEENLAQAVAAVAHVIAANENDRRNGAAIDSLLPHAERLRQFSAANEWTLR
jgi:hypothetical protein